MYMMSQVFLIKIIYNDEKIINDCIYYVIAIEGNVGVSSVMSPSADI